MARTKTIFTIQTWTCKRRLVKYATTVAVHVRPKDFKSEEQGSGGKAAHLLPSGAAPRKKRVKSGALLRGGKARFASGGTSISPFVSSKLLTNEKTASHDLQDGLPDLHVLS